MAVAFDASAQASALSTTGLTYSHTCTGSDLLLCVGVYVNPAAATIDAAPTYNSVSLTEVVAQTEIQAGEDLYGAALLNPATGANNVVTSNSSAGASLSQSMSFTGVDQTDIATAIPSANRQTSFTTGTAISMTVTSAADNMIAGFAAGDDDGPGGRSFTSDGTGQTERQDVATGFHVMTCASQTGAASRDHDYTMSAGSHHGAFAWDLLAAGGAPTANPKNPLGHPVRGPFSGPVH